MIIWSRWGLLLLVPVLLGTASGALLAEVVIGGDDDNPLYGIFLSVGIVLGAVYAYFFDRYVIDRHLDRARPHVLLERLPQPQGAQTYRHVPVLDPQTGQPLMVKPRSTLFFIPTRIWPAIIAVVGVLALLLSSVSALTG